MQAQAFSNKSAQLKPQDLLLLFKLIASSLKKARVIDISIDIGLSASETSQSLERLFRAKLIKENKRDVISSNAADFIIYGAKYTFPATLGPVLRGLPTAHSAKPLSSRLVVVESDKYIWPFTDGQERGQSIVPLYPSVPMAAKKDPKLYELLALFDALRIGRVREQKIAAEELKERISAHRATDD